MHKIIKQIFNLICFLIITSELTYAHDILPVTDPNINKTDPAKLNQIIQKKIDYYNKTYPEIRFMQIDGGDDWHGDMVALITMLGTNPTALDYQHPPQLREMLMEATLQRLKLMLESDTVSATLFRVGKDSVVGRANLCVITLNPKEFVANDYTATRYMLDLSDEEMKKVHTSRYLDHIHHLEFTMDHEAFHCMDSYFNGGAPQTHKQLGGEYNLFKRESISDAYAMIIHIREHGDLTNYARNIVHARALWLFSDSPNRCTFETIREVLSYDFEALRSTSIQQLIGLVAHIRNKTVGDYDSYVIQRIAAVNAAKKLGMDLKYYGDQWEVLSKNPTNPALVEHLVNRYQYYYAKLFTDDPVLMEAPHKHDWIK